MKHIFLPLIFILVTLPVMADYSVIVTDTYCERGLTAIIEVRGTFEADNIKSAILKMTYDARLVNIQRAWGDDNSAFACNDIIISKETTEPENALATFECSRLNSAQDDILFYIEIKGLAHEDSLSQMAPIALILDSQLVDTDFTAGTITLSQNNIFVNNNDNMGTNYPNPFVGQTVFPFSIGNESKVEFKLYSMDGRLVLSSEDHKGCLWYEELGNSSTRSTDFSGYFAKASYVLVLTMDMNIVPAGAYYFLMKTDSGVRSKYIMITK